MLNMVVMSYFLTGTSLNTGQVTFVEALDQLMPGFDPEIAKLAQRVLINPRKIDYHTSVFASKVSFTFQHSLEDSFE